MKDETNLESSLLIAQSALASAISSVIASVGHLPPADLIEFDVVQLDIQWHFWYPHSQRAGALHVPISGYQRSVSRAPHFRPVQIDGRARRRHLNQQRLGQ